MKDLSIDNGEIKGFVFKQLGAERELAEKAFKSIEQGDAKYIQSFLKNPLLLSLYLLTFQNNASIPDKKYIFYRRVINALFSEHDSKTKLGYVREKLCGLDQEKFEMILKSYSFLSYFENEFSFNRDYVNYKLKLIKEKRDIHFDNNKFITDLKSAISLWIDDDGQLSFAHRSLQEYFTALFITELKDEENSRVYNKIISKFEQAKSAPIREIENLLQLLREMDEYNYHKNFYYPLLVNLKQEINASEFVSPNKKYLDFFVDGIVEFKTKINKSGAWDYSYSPLRSDKIDKAIYIHLPFTRKLNDFLRDNLNDEKVISNFRCKLKENKSNKIINQQIRPSSRYLKFEESDFEKFFGLVNGDILEKLTKELFDFIDQEIEYCENYIGKIDDTQKDLVDLI